jgi:hypothetical protein
LTYTRADNIDTDAIASLYNNAPQKKNQKKHNLCSKQDAENPLKKSELEGKYTVLI